MRRLIALFALLACGLASAAWADVTVRYKVEGGGPTIRIAAADGGNLRLQAFGPDGRSLGGLITRDGVGYIVGKDAGGLWVARQDDLMALFAQMMGGPGGRQGIAAMQGVFGGEYRISEGGPATVGGRQGTIYRIAAVRANPGPGGPPPMEIVMSSDPDIAPAGRELARLLNVSVGALSGALGSTPDMIAKVGEVLARGTPLKAGPLTLDSVSAAPIPAGSFDLPAPVLSRDALMARLMPRPPAAAPPAATPATPAPGDADDDDEGDDHDHGDGPDPR